MQINSSLKAQPLTSQIKTSQPQNEPPADSAVFADRFEPVGTSLATGIGTIMGAAAGVGAHFGGWAGLGIATAATTVVVGGASAWLSNTLDPGAKGAAIAGSVLVTAVPTAIAGAIGMATGNPLLVSTGVGLLGGLGVGLVATSQ